MTATDWRLTFLYIKFRADAIEVVHVAYVITRADTIAGAQTHVAELSSELLQLGHRATVICGPGEAFTRMLCSQNIPFVQLDELGRSISPIRDFAAFRALKKTLVDINPDIISLHSSKAGILGRLCHSVFGVPLIFTAHGWSFADGVGTLKKIVYSRIEKSFQHRCDRVICVSYADRDLAVSQGFDVDQIRVVHNGRHDRYKRLRNPEKPRLRGRDFRVIMIGRLDAQKDHDTLFDAFARLSGAQLLLVGDGPRREELEHRAEKMGIADKVTFYGLLPDVSDSLDEADAFVLISRWEGFPRSTLEAMSAALPVVVSDVGGAAEAVECGESGFVVARGDATSIETCLRKLIEDSRLARDMGMRGRKRYEEHFTFEKMRDRTFEIYRDVLAVRGIEFHFDK